MTVSLLHQPNYSLKIHNYLGRSCPLGGEKRAFSTFKQGLSIANLCLATHYNNVPLQHGYRLWPGGS